MAVFSCSLKRVKMNKFVGYLVLVIFLGLPSGGFAQENSGKEQEKKEAVEPSVQKDNQIRFGIGFNYKIADF